METREDPESSGWENSESNTEHGAGQDPESNSESKTGRGGRDGDPMERWEAAEDRIMAANVAVLRQQQDILRSQGNLEGVQALEDSIAKLPLQNQLKSESSGWENSESNTEHGAESNTEQDPESSGWENSESNTEQDPESSGWENSESNTEQDPESNGEAGGPTGKNHRHPGFGSKNYEVEQLEVDPVVPLDDNSFLPGGLGEFSDGKRHSFRVTQSGGLELVQLQVEGLVG